jgi:nucleoside-diphosphate-sugar epimerase
VIHIASPISGKAPEEIIPTAVTGALNALKAAAKESSVKRVVITSSSLAATMPKPNVEFSISEESFNDEAVQKAWNFPEGEDPSLRGIYLYGASKTQAEKESWRWVRENRPKFVFNTVVRTNLSGFPSINFMR